MEINACTKLLLLITFQIGYMEFVGELDGVLIKFLILPLRGQKKFIFIFKAWSHTRFPEYNRVCSGFLTSCWRCLYNTHFIKDPESRQKKQHYCSLSQCMDSSGIHFSWEMSHRQKHYILTTSCYVSPETDNFDPTSVGLPLFIA